MPRLSHLVGNLTAETAFTVLAIARALKAQGKDVVELEIGDSPFPSTPNAKRRASGRSRRTRRATARAWGSPSSARPPPGSSRRSSATPRRPRTSWSARGPSRSSSSSPRRCSTRATGSWSSAPSSRPTSRTSSAAGRGPCWCRCGRAGVPAVRRGRAAVPGHGPAAPGDLPQLAAQPDRRRGHPRGPGRDRRCGPGHRPDGLLRRAVLPHGLGRTSTRRSWPSRGCSSTRWRPTPSASRTA